MQVSEIIIEKAEHVVEEEDPNKGIDSGIVSIGNVRLKDVSVNNEDNPFDTESEIKVVKRFQPWPDDEDQITFLGPVYNEMDTDPNMFTVKTISGSLSIVQEDVDPDKADSNLVSMPEDDIKLDINTLALSDRYPTYHETSSGQVNMDDPNITMEEYIRPEEEKVQKRRKEFKWETAKYDSENDNDKVNMPSFPSPEPTVSCLNDLDFFKDFENEFPAIIYNDALTSKSDFSTEPTLSPRHIDEFDLKDETSLSECDEEEQNVLYFNDVFPFNVIYLDDSKSDRDNDDDKIDIKRSLRDINMDSSMGKMCLGKDVIEISSDQNKGSRNWDSPEYKDTAGSGGKKEPEALVFHKMDNEEDSDRYIAQCFVNGLYASDGEINLEKNDNLISNDYAVKLCLEYEVRKGKNIDEEGNPNLDNFETLLDFDFDEVPQTKTDLPLMVSKIGKGSRNKKKIMENIMYFNNGARPSSSVGTPLTQEEAEKRAHAHNINIRLDGKIKPEEERAMVKVKGRMLKEKKDLGVFIFPIRLEGLINENALADTGSDTNTMPYRIYEQLGKDDIMQEERNITMINYTEAKVTGQLVNVLCQVGFTILSAQFLILEIPIDRDAPIVVGHRFLDTIRGNIDIPNRILITFDGLTRQTFRVARSEKIRIAESNSDDEEDYTSGSYDHEVGSSRAKRSRNVETVEEALRPDVHHEFLEWSGCSREAKSQLGWERQCRHHELSSLPERARKLKPVEEAYSQDCQLLHKISYGEEIDTMLKISLKEAESDEEIFFYVAWVRAFNIREPIYLELCRKFYATYEFDERLGLYHADELEKEGFDTYFQGGLRSDENFNAREYCERISIDRDLHLSRSSITFVRFSILKARHQNGYANVAGVIAKWIKRKGAGSQKDSQIYCKLIDSEDRLIPDILVDNVPRVAAQRTPRVQRALMQDLYERMGSMEIKQEAIERLEYR
ncbi:reverse transcriptase domain-containing protein [Tanacetum coccineum]